MTAPYTNAAGGAFGNQIDGFVYPQFLFSPMRPPTSQDIYTSGTRWQDNSVNPPVIYETTGAGRWNQAGGAIATTTTAGSVFLGTLAQLEGGTAPAGAYVPLTNDVFTYVQGVVLGGANIAQTTVTGITNLATNAEALAGTATVPGVTALAVQPSNLPAVFASPFAIGGTTPAGASFTTLAASGNTTVGGTFGVTGASTIAALSATSGTFSTTLGVTGAVTFSSTLGVTGASTIAALSATSGTFSTTLGVTGNATFGGTVGITGTLTTAAIAATNAVLSGTLGVTGASSFSSGTFSTTLGVTGASSFSSGSFSTTLGVTGLTTLAALTQVGTTNINVSGSAITNIATGGTGALNIGNATGNTALTGALTISTTLAVTGLTTLAALTQVGTTNLNASGSAATNVGTGTGTVTIGNTTGTVTITGATGATHGVQITNGPLNIATAGQYLGIKGATFAATNFIGLGTLASGTVTIANTNIATGDVILLARTGTNGSTTLGELTYTISNATSFTVTSWIFGTPGSPQTGDTSTFSYIIVRPT